MLKAGQAGLVDGEDVKAKNCPLLFNSKLLTRAAEVALEGEGGVQETAQEFAGPPAELRASARRKQARVRWRKAGAERTGPRPPCSQSPSASHRGGVPETVSALPRLAAGGALCLSFA